jgi:hypothetical protein
MEVVKVKDPKIINISIGDRHITIDLALKDEELIDVFLDALSKYVSQGSQVKIFQTYGESLTDSKRIINKVISKVSQMNEWRSELKQLLYVMQKGA